MTDGRVRVGLVTCRMLPEPDPDASLLAEALRAAGLAPVAVPWDRAGPGPEHGGLHVLRSCWNAHERPDEFLAWLEAASARVRLQNDPDVVRWNFHKRYLLELAREGIPIVPTRLYPRGQPVGRLPDGPGWEEIVVKPAISAASWRTRRFPPAERSAAAAFLASLLGERDAMVQPYQRGVETGGERAVVWIDGHVTHAVRKSPRFSGSDERVSGALPVSRDEREIAERAIGFVTRRFGRPPLYARVDLMPGRDGRARVSELELIEPSLFLAQDPEALRRFVAAIVREATAAP